MDQEQYMKALQSLEIQKKYIDSYQAQLSAFELQISDLTTARETIESYGKLKAGDDILVPVGGDVFVFGKIGDPKSVLAGIGAGITVQESAGKAITRLTGKIDSMTRMREKLEQELGSIEMQYRSLSRKVEAEYTEMMRERQQGAPVQPGKD